MARRYFRRYRRGRRYSRKRYARKRYIRGVDRNSFCLTVSDNVIYKFEANQVIGFPSKFVDFAIKDFTEGSRVVCAIAVTDSKKFQLLHKLFDQVRVKGMSVKFSYATGNGLSAQTLNLYTVVDRSTTWKELYANYKLMTTSATTQSTYLDKLDNAASKRKYSLTGGKTIYSYYRPASMQEKMFMPIDVDGNGQTYEVITNVNAGDNNFSGFNPCIYSYMEKPSADSQEVNIPVNVEIKYYIEFRNSV